MISTDVCSPSFQSYVRICSLPFTKQASPFFKNSAQAVPKPLNATIMWNYGKSIPLIDCFFVETSFLGDRVAPNSSNEATPLMETSWAWSDSNVLSLLVDARARGRGSAFQADLGLAQNTLDAYCRVLEDFLSYSGRTGVDVPTAGRSQIAAYVRDLASRPNRRAAKVVRLDSGVGLANATLQ